MGQSSYYKLGFAKTVQNSTACGAEYPYDKDCTTGRGIIAGTEGFGLLASIIRHSSHPHLECRNARFYRLEFWNGSYVNGRFNV
jgi:hypothetical protein